MATHKDITKKRMKNKSIQSKEGNLRAGGSAVNFLAEKIDNDKEKFIKTHRIKKEKDLQSGGDEAKETNRRKSTGKYQQGKAHEHVEHIAAQMKEIAGENRYHPEFRAALAENIRGLASILDNFPDTIFTLENAKETTSPDASSATVEDETQGCVTTGARGRVEPIARDRHVAPPRSFPQSPPGNICT